jgi:FAD/FMN-containing dehydrogenase
MWSRAFVPVPTSYLTVESLSGGKRTPEEYRQYMATVPELYRLQLAGVAEQQFRQFAEAPRNTAEQRLGSAYRDLFSSSPSAQPMRAEFIDQRGLVVQAGQHRVEAAKQLGLPYVPVHVAAPTSDDVRKLQDACEQEVARLTPEMAGVVQLHRAQDMRAYPDRERVFQPERHIARERAEPERDRDWRSPERER